MEWRMLQIAEHNARELRPTGQINPRNWRCEPRDETARESNWPAQDGCGRLIFLAQIYINIQ